jgi:predicted O-linked N-acetylglucosamine transferase (SPINDLY family)
VSLGRSGVVEAAQAIRDAQIHVLVDLMGHTRANRIGVLSRRPAPIQATWLGHPGTTGAAFIDYIILDPILAPPGERPAVSEAVARLPCYQANGPLRPLGPPPARATEGLPATGPVLACPNRPEKLDPESFMLWMQILAQVPDAVLWLGPFEAEPVAALRAHARGAGIDPDRLCFADRRPKAAHLRRLQLVDLGLDTLVYGAHTTASDLLRAGAPMLTVRGPSIASRVAASLLSRCGLDDTLVVPCADDYVARAVDLLTRPGALDELRARVRAGRHRLCDPVAMAGDLEALYAAWTAPA